MLDSNEEQKAKDVADQIGDSLNLPDDSTEVEAEEKEGEVDKITVGDKEYTQDELNRVVKLGEIGVEAEEKYNTKIDSVWPEFSKSRNEVKDLQAKVEELQRGNIAPITEGTDEQVNEALEAAKSLGLMTKDEFDTLYAERRAGERLLEQAEKLESDIDGTDGRPKFDKVEILEYMRDNPGISDPALAYRIKYEGALDTWKENKINGAKKDNIVTTSKSGTSGKNPPEVRPNKDNLDALVRESLG